MKKKLLAMFLCAALMLMGASALAWQSPTGWVMEVTNCESWVSLREEPSTGAARLAKVPLHARVNAIQYAENGFVYVEYRGQAGYILDQYLQVMVNYTGGAVALTDAQRYNVNLFLSNFSEAGFAWGTWCYDSAAPRDADLIRFGINHVWFNQQHHLSWGEYGANNVRLAREYVGKSIDKYLGVQPGNWYGSDYDYDGAYYYWEETGGHTSDGFACLDDIFDLGGGRYSVRFSMYGAGEMWSNDACHLSPSQAQGAYGTPVAWGHAVINTHGGGLNDRSAWKLERWTMARNW